MSVKIGENIKALRKDCGITQETLAAHLGVSTQSISKWETGISSPDISQLGPLAQYFHVSVDYLLGNGPSELEAQKNEYYGLASVTREENSSIWEAYSKLQLLIEKFPFDTRLLTDSLDLGFRVICPDDPYYDPKHVEKVFENSVRAGSLLLLYEHSVDNKQRIKRRLVQLYAVHKDFDRARELAMELPLSERIEVFAWILHYEGDYNKEITQYGVSFYYRLKEQLNEFANMCLACLASEAWTDAVSICESAFALIRYLFPKSPLPALHWLDAGDLHQISAKAFIAMGDKNGALQQLSEMVEFDTQWIHEPMPAFQANANPLIRDLWYVWYAHSSTLTNANIRDRLVKKLTDPAFSGLCDVPRYVELLKAANNIV